MTERRWRRTFCAVAFLAAAWTGCSNVPDECDPEGPLESPACGDALARLCAELTTEEDCSGSEPLRFDEPRVEYYCAWADVAVVGDEQACAIASTTHRCVAVHDDTGTEDGCPARCVEYRGGYDNPQSSFVVLTSGELLSLPCGRAGAFIYGPIDGTILGPPEERSWSSCGDPAAPAVCDCAAQACAAL